MIQRGFALQLGEGCSVPVPPSAWGLGGGVVVFWFLSLK